MGGQRARRARRNDGQNSPRRCPRSTVCSAAARKISFDPAVVSQAGYADQRHPIAQLSGAAYWPLIELPGDRQRDSDYALVPAAAECAAIEVVPPRGAPTNGFMMILLSGVRLVPYTVVAPITALVRPCRAPTPRSQVARLAAIGLEGRRLVGDVLGVVNPMALGYCAAQIESFAFCKFRGIAQKLPKKRKRPLGGGLTLCFPWRPHGGHHRDARQPHHASLRAMQSTPAVAIQRETLLSATAATRPGRFISKSRAPCSGGKSVQIPIDMSRGR